MNIALAIFLALMVPALFWNHEIFLVINGFHFGVLDAFLGTIGGLSDGLVTVILILTLLQFKFRLGLAALTSFIVSGVITQIIKRSLNTPRPPLLFDDVHILGSTLNHHSFPSGHAATAGVLALLSILIWKSNKVLSWVLFSIFTLAAYSRIYGGVHFPVDVIAGFSIGALCMWWYNKASMQWNIGTWEHSPWSWKISGLLAIAASIYLAISYKIQPSTAQLLTFIIPIATLFLISHSWKQRLNHDR